MKGENFGTIHKHMVFKSSNNGIQCWTIGHFIHVFTYWSIMHSWNSFPNPSHGECGNYYKKPTLKFLYGTFKRNYQMLNVAFS